MTNDDTTVPLVDRRVVLKMLADGEATYAEIADLLQTSRQLVRFWAQSAGIDAGAARTTYLMRTYLRRGGRITTTR